MLNLWLGNLATKRSMCHNRLTVFDGRMIVVVTSRESVKWHKE